MAHGVGSRIAVYREVNLAERANSRHVLRVANAPVHTSRCFIVSEQHFNGAIFMCSSQLLQAFRLVECVAYSSAHNLLTHSIFFSLHFCAQSIQSFSRLRSKVIVYRFHAMIKFNIPINFILLHWSLFFLLLVDDGLCADLARVCIMNSFFSCLVCKAKLSINIIFIIFIPFQLFQQTFLPLCCVLLIHSRV